jgi:hypothetical protein
VGQKVLDAGTHVANFVGLGDASETIGTNLANILNVLDPRTSKKEKLAVAENLPQTTLRQNIGAGASIGLQTGGVEFGAPRAVAAGVSRNAAKTAIRVAETIAPKMTAKETATALAARGGTKAGPLAKITANVEPSVLKVAKTIEEFVPDFHPSKTLVENINATRNGIARLASRLKQAVVEQGHDQIYPIKELAAQIKNTPKPTLLVGDLEKVHQRVVDKMLEIARANGGKVSDLFDARKEFDSFIQKEFPNLYASDQLTPMRVAIKDIRRTVNDFIASHLPEDIHFHDSLAHQSRLYTALENMAEKAASGSAKEIGTNVLTRAAKRHPNITRLLKYGTAGVAGAEAAHAVTQ